MALFKLGDKIFSIGDDIHLLAELDHKREDGALVTRFQSRNRRDEVVNVAGRPVHIKHGVYELTPELSEKFKWFINLLGQSIGMIDVDAQWERREEINKLIEDMKKQQNNQLTKELGNKGSNLPPLKMDEFINKVNKNKGGR